MGFWRSSILKRLYVSIFGDVVHLGQYIRILYFRKEIKNIRFNAVLDTGCGSGVYTFYLAKRYPQIRIDACDLNEDAINSCKKLQKTTSFNNINFYTMDLKNLEAKNQYDFVYSIDVLEHIKSNKKVIENIYNSLKDGGKFYLHMPGKVQRRIFPEKYFSNFNKWAKEEHIGEHYNLEELRELMNNIGFKIIKSRYTFGLFGKLAWELDRLTDSHRRIKLCLMPLLKIFGRIDTIMKNKNGNILIIGEK